MIFANGSKRHRNRHNGSNVPQIPPQHSTVSGLKPAPCRQRSPRGGLRLGSSIQRRDLARIQTAATSIPGSRQFFLMHRRPFKNQFSRSGWKVPFDNLEGSNIDLRLVLRVNSVKMRWWVIRGEYSNNYAVEATEFRHEPTVAACHRPWCR